MKVPDGLALSEFKGYEKWQVIAVSQGGNIIDVIVGNPEMIAAYQSGLPAEGKKFPDGVKMVKIHWNSKKAAGWLSRPGAGHVARPRHHGEGQQALCRHRRLGLWPVQL